MNIEKKENQKSGAIKFIVSIDGRDVGRAYLYLIYNDLHNRPYGLLEDVFVEKDFRGQGIGTKLVENVVEEAQKKDCYKLIGQSRFGREKVHELYERIGFNKHGFNFRIDLGNKTKKQ